MSYAGIGRRGLAFLIDALVMVALAYVLALFFNMGNLDAFVISGILVIVPLVWFTYHVILEVEGGATLGKMALGLRVVDTEGSPISYEASLVRNLMRLVDGLFFYLVGAVFALQSPIGQRLGDRLAGTVVVHSAPQPSREAV